MTEHLPRILRAGVGDPVFLLHGVTGGPDMWRDVLPIVGQGFDAIAPAALGHAGGRAPTVRPARIAHLLDDLELTMDRLEIETAHFAGNSMGGWMALEMARRGRARSVCALSPAGTWDGESKTHRRTRRTIQLASRASRPLRPVIGVCSRSSLVRRASLWSTAMHGERVAPELFRDVAEAAADCIVVDDIVWTPETLAPLDPPPCPISIAWSETDRVLPRLTNGANARELVPGADWSVLRGVGHVPMFDDPQLTAWTILEVVRDAQAAANA